MGSPAKTNMSSVQFSPPQTHSSSLCLSPQCNLYFVVKSEILDTWRPAPSYADILAASYILKSQCETFAPFADVKLFHGANKTFVHPLATQYCFTHSLNLKCFFQWYTWHPKKTKKKPNKRGQQGENKMVKHVRNVSVEIQGNMQTDKANRTSLCGFSPAAPVSSHSSNTSLLS